MADQLQTNTPRIALSVKLRPLMRFAVARLREPSSWRGIILFCTGLGASVEPAMALQIISVGVSIAGLVGMMMGDDTDPLE